MNSYEKFCVICGQSFTAKTAWAKYCGRSCATKQYREAHGLHKLKNGRFCKQCGQHFHPDGVRQNNRHHCSRECALKSAREARSKFWKNQPDAKAKMAAYYAKSREKLGPDGNLKRFYARYPDAPRACQSCGETRVLDVAHKPEHRRNGHWRSARNTVWPEKVWVLCPTCHALLDRMHYPPAELGLE